VSVIWHDLECGSYQADLPVWRSLAKREGDPILDVGAGTGRVALDLCARGHRVTALDNDPELVQELRRRANGLDLRVELADARAFELGEEFALCLVPMQTIQLLGGPSGRGAFLDRARRHLRAGGLLAIAIAAQLELYEVTEGGPAPLPDVCERDGVVYASRPTAVRATDGHLVLERHRETVAPDGRHAVEDHAITLDRVTAAELLRETRAAGLRPAGRETISATRDYAGSEVVTVRA
jgi:SAM-dependent methyltransferase